MNVRKGGIRKNSGERGNVNGGDSQRTGNAGKFLLQDLNLLFKVGEFLFEIGHLFGWVLLQRVYTEMVEIWQAVMMFKDITRRPFCMLLRKGERVRSNLGGCDVRGKKLGNRQTKIGEWELATSEAVKSPASVGGGRCQIVLGED